MELLHSKAAGLVLLLGSVTTVLGLAVWYFQFKGSIPASWAWISTLVLLAESGNVSNV